MRVHARVLILVAGLTMAGCASSSSEEAKASLPGRDGGDKSQPPIAGKGDYENAKNAVAMGDIAVAIDHLQKATAANPECAEYWYNLGAAQANRAIQVVNDDESEAVRLFTESVASKRRALELMNQGKFQIYDAAQQAQVKSDAENGLRDADAVLANREYLIAALKTYAGRR